MKNFGNTFWTQLTINILVFLMFTFCIINVRMKVFVGSFTFLWSRNEFLPFNRKGQSKHLVTARILIFKLQIYKVTNSEPPVLLNFAENILRLAPSILTINFSPSLSIQSLLVTQRIWFSIIFFKCPPFVRPNDLITMHLVIFEPILIVSRGYRKTYMKCFPLKYEMIFFWKKA